MNVATTVLLAPRPRSAAVEWLDDGRP